MLGRGRVLIIDEDRRTVDRLQETCVRSGYEAEVALSGLVGVTIASERPMSVALLSARVGQLQNWDLVRRLKQSDPKLPVVMFGGPKVKGLSQEARRAGVSKFIVEGGDELAVLNEAVKVKRN